VATTTADITALHITGAFTAGNKPYDGTNSATVLTRSVTGTIGADAVVLTGGTATFDNKNVGMGKTVTLAGAVLSGADAANYFLDSVATTTANITALHITGTFTTASSKEYDGSTAATVLTRGLVGAISGDAVSLYGGTASFGDKNVGVGKTVTLSGATLAGGDAGNYILDSVATTTANITAKPVTASGITASDKPYDGTTAATLGFANASLGTLVSGDTVTLNIAGAIGTFNTASVGSGKPVTVIGLALGGSSAGNYTLTLPYTTTASITAWSLAGFYQPVTMSGTGPALFNSIKGGQTVPLKFNVRQSAGGPELTTLPAVQSMMLVPVSCSDGVPTLDMDPAALSNTGGTALRYDGSQFIENWQTPKQAGLCYVVKMTSADGSTLSAYFKTK
jgi:hypothetical protein